MSIVKMFFGALRFYQIDPLLSSESAGSKLVELGYENRNAAS